MKNSYKYFILFLFFQSLNCGYESEDRDKLESAFQANFDFSPPKSVEVIKLKNWSMYDTRVHWMAFTYDSTVFNKIIANDQPLNIAEKSSREFADITEDLKSDKHHPEWLQLPSSKTDRIYYKKGFLDHTSSEYYLWHDTEAAMTFLYVSYYD